jgi:mono/diheme cytochrome c family protein
MGKALRPLLLLACVSAAVFALALGAFLSPSAPSAGGSEVVLGDLYRGEVLYGQTCASCHGAGGEGGVGPALAGSGLTPAQVKAQIDRGGGVMPAGLVTGRDEEDVLAWVDVLAQP